MISLESIYRVITFATILERNMYHRTKQVENKCNKLCLMELDGVTQTHYNITIIIISHRMLKGLSLLALNCEMKVFFLWCQRGVITTSPHVHSNNVCLVINDGLDTVGGLETEIQDKISSHPFPFLYLRSCVDIVNRVFKGFFV